MTEFRNIPAFLERELRSPVGTQQHWSSASQTYAPAEALMQCQANGWIISPIVGRQEYQLGGGRRVCVFHFELTKGQRQIVMQVHGNPVVRRLVRERSFRIIHLDCADSAQPGHTLDM